MTIGRYASGLPCWFSRSPCASCCSSCPGIRWIFGRTNAGRFALGSPWVVASLYLVQPAVFVDSGRWGQPDAIHTFLVLLALAFVLRGRTAFGWIPMTLACLMKPLALPFVPLLALATLRRATIR